MIRYPLFVLAGLALSNAAHAQTTAAPKPPAPAPDAAPSSLSVYFASGSTSVRPDDVAVLDHASRLYRDGHPIVMIVSGSSDSTGDASANLRLSQERADSVVRALVARGIPVDRFQVLAKGATDLAVPTPPKTPEARNRNVQITWR
jgi:outer membrane protein OmpA-like peptidoglycan-associated protein